jgi:hypothetical protein
LKILSLLLAASCAWAATNEPSIIYSKAFPGSTPAYVKIQVSRSGSSVYQEEPNDQDAVAFQLAPADTSQIFELATKLKHFKDPLESNLKVANMGMKTFRWQDGTASHETKFNYSLDENAKLLVDWFDRITETQQHSFNLDRAVRFDKLGVNKVILQLETALNRKRIVGPERFLPLLDRVAKNESFIHMARERAASLAERIRNPVPAAVAE